jgi:hypothetical protein
MALAMLLVELRIDADISFTSEIVLLMEHLHYKILLRKFWRL